MANHVKNNIRIVGNEKVKETVEKYLDALEELSYADTGGFAKIFYKNPEIGEGGGTMNTWANNNIGSKWAYMDEIIDDMEFQVTSAWYPTKEFTLHLYNLLVEIDPNVAVENRFEDETYDPVGCILVYKNQMFMDEDTDFEYPDEDEMESDNSYEDAMTELYDSVGMTQNAFIERGYNIINDGEGNPFEFKEMATQAK
jgi:hypothetical protein|tara:strand:- start:777 stop:1370 length:594 start_codon:yes stop_codon:yes gene_type:complete